MATSTEAPLPGSAPAPRKGFRDSLGDRLIVTGAGENELLEVLHLRRELTAVASFEFALRERAARLANFQHNGYARVRQIDRLPPPDGRLAIVSEHVAGWRLVEILSAVQERHLELDINAALSLIKQLVHGVAILHQHARGVAHGALGPERVVVTAHARLSIVEYVLGSALERLDMSRERLWRELRIAIPAAAGAARFDPRADVTQVGTVAMALVLGCPLAGDDYPDHMAELLAMATENRTLGGRRPLSKPLRAWLARALQLDLHRSFPSAIEAESELEALLIAEPSYVTAPVALETFLAAYQRSTAMAPPVAPEHPDNEVAEEHEIVLPVEGAVATDERLDLDGVIGDLDSFLGESAPPKPAAFTPPPVAAAPEPRPRPVPEPEHRDLGLSARPAVETPEIPRVAPASPVSDRFERLQHLESRPLREPDRAAAPPVPVGARGDIRPPKPVTEPAARPTLGVPRSGSESATSSFPARSDKPAFEPPARPATSARPGTDIGRQGLPPVPKPAEERLQRPAVADVERDHPNSFGSMFGQGAPAEFDRRQPEPEPQDETVEDEAPRKGGVLKIGLAAAALVVLAIGGFFLYRMLSAPATPTTGTLTVESQPSGLAIKIDGSPRGSTPLKVQLPPGQHQIEFDNGGQPRVMPVTITAGAQASQYIETQSAPATGKLQVTSQPAGATVFVDGARKGTAPLLVSDLAVGHHQVELRADGATVQQDVTIDPGGTSSLVVPMTSTSSGPVSGWLSVSAPVELQVYEGEQLVGTSQSDRILMTAGRHEIDVVNDTLGYRSRQTIQVPPGKLVTVKAQLPKGALSVNAIPWADVLVDGEPKGQTPIGNLSLTIGPHEIVFRHPQFGELKQAVTVTAKAPARVSVDLRK